MFGVLYELYKRKIRTSSSTSSSCSSTYEKERDKDTLSKESRITDISYDNVVHRLCSKGRKKTEDILLL